MIASRQPVILCAGAAVVDTSFVLAAKSRPGTSNPAMRTQSLGGVARNVSSNLARLGAHSLLLALVGDDAAGRDVLRATKRRGVDISPSRIMKGHKTGAYVSLVEPDGSLVIGAIDVDIIHALDASMIIAAIKAAGNVDALFIDTNLSATVIRQVIDYCSDEGLPLAMDAVSVPKATHLPCDLRGIDTLFCNCDEARAILRANKKEPPEAVETLVARGARRVIVSAGAAGLWAGDSADVFHVPATPAEVTDETGAGDALIAGTLYGLGQGHTLHQAAALGAHAAATALTTATRVLRKER